MVKTYRITFPAFQFASNYSSRKKLIEYVFECIKEDNFRDEKIKIIEVKTGETIG